jgi:hypothetical protein
MAAAAADRGAMESTGVYWIPIFEILKARGPEVVLVNAHHMRNVRGRKSDVTAMLRAGSASLACRKDGPCAVNCRRNCYAEGYANAAIPSSR